jgi:hypothetical protein
LAKDHQRKIQVVQKSPNATQGEAPFFFIKLKTIFMETRTMSFLDFSRNQIRKLCPSPVLRKDKVEEFVTDRVKGYILTEENLEELVRLTNEEPAQTCDEEKERLKLIEAQIAEADSRLSKLYDALETGEFKGRVLAPRIQALFYQKDELQRAKSEAEEGLRY